MTFQQYPFKGGIPSGNTAGRPSGPTIGDTYYNGELGLLEIYDGTNWVPSSAPAGIPSVVGTDVGTGRPYASGQFTYVLTPGTNGGSPYGYNLAATNSIPVTYSTGSVTSPTGTLTVGGPGNYNLAATAYNGFGTSPASVAVSLSVTTVPQAPTIGTATGLTTGGAVSLAFTAGNTGGKAITNYKVSTDGVTYTALSPAQTTSPLSITGLTNNTAYSFYIKAVNDNGDSIASGVSNSATPTLLISGIDFLVQAGGAGGGSVGYGGGGGGAGGMRSSVSGTGGSIGTLETPLTATSGVPYTITVGAGSAGATYTGNSESAANGSNSVLRTITSLGGGGGGGLSGGTGGGGNFMITQQGGPIAGGTGTSNQGYNGGAGGPSSQDYGGGGGGTGAVGASGSNGVGGNGGAGRSNSITGTAVNYGGGGGGGVYSGAATVAGTGGVGGGGTGAKLDGNVATAGTANTGGGGGGGSGPDTRVGKAGGSGIIIIKIANTLAATFSAGVTSSLSTAVAGFKIYTVTAAGVSDTVTFS